MKNLLEIVAQSEIKAIQQKINQWSTTGLLVKYDVTPLHGGNMLFRILLKKEA